MGHGTLSFYRMHLSSDEHFIQQRVCLLSSMAGHSEAAWPWGYGMCQRPFWSICVRCIVSCGSLQGEAPRSVRKRAGAVFYYLQA